MIKLQDLTPQIYYQQSRDFQFIGRLYDLVLNSVKTNADTLYGLPNGKNIDDILLNLLSLSLGFKSKHHYNALQLRAICSVLPEILRHKGSVNSILTAVNALLCAEGIAQPIDYTISSKEKLILYLPTELNDLTLLYDMLTYILPAGISCELIKEIAETKQVKTAVGISDSVTAYTITRSSESAIMPGMLSGVAQLKTGVGINTGRASVIPGLMANTTIQNAMTLPVSGLAEIHPDNDITPVTGEDQ